MPDAFLDFEWTVAPAYEWQDWLDKHGKPVIVHAAGRAALASPSAVERAWKQTSERETGTGPVLRAVLNDANELRRYYPMQRRHAALFRDFERLDYRDRAAILAFAAEHGLLGLQQQHQTRKFRNKSGSTRYHSADGESHLAWAREICYMQEGLRLSERWTPFERVRRLKWLFDRHLQDVRARVSFNRDGDSRLAIEPLTLISAMWLQLALTVTGGKRFITCKFCGRLFEISTDPSGFRSHREFCTDACKTKDYRRRKRTAMKLAEGGASVAAMAERIDTKKATIKGWLAASRARGKGKK